MASDLVHTTLCNIITSQKDSLDKLEKELQETKKHLNTAKGTTLEAVENALSAYRDRDDDLKKTRKELVGVAQSVFGPIVRVFPETQIQCSSDKYAIRTTLGLVSDVKYGSIVFLQPSPVSGDTAYVVYASYGEYGMILEKFPREGKRVTTIEAVIESLHELETLIPENLTEELVSHVKKSTFSEFTNWLKTFATKHENCPLHPTPKKSSESSENSSESSSEETADPPREEGPPSFA